LKEDKINDDVDMIDFQTDNEVDETEQTESEEIIDLVADEEEIKNFDLKVFNFIN